MRELKDAGLDAKTRKAWEKNWEEISIEEILTIFNYVRVKKQMDIFTRVLPKNEKILEGGCGLCPYLIRLRQLGYDVEGIDYNEEPLRKVLSYDPSLPVKQGDVAQIPYENGSFGGYISLGVIEHFTEGPKRAIQEANRVLKPGGVFVVMVPRHHLFAKLQAPIHFIKSQKWLRKLLNKSDEQHYWEQYFKKDELARMIEDEGFEVREIHPLDHSAALMSFSTVFRNKDSFDEASELALKISAWCEKVLPWSTAAQMLMICYKK